MKKVATVAARPSKKISQQKLTVGLDLGDRFSWYCGLDESGAVVMEQRVSTTPTAVSEMFGGVPHGRIALERGTHSPWVSRLLRELGHEVIVAHVRNVRLIGESRKKDDRLDAQTLARLARIDPQPQRPVKHRSAKALAELTVIRERAGLVRALTALVNTAHRLAKSYGERIAKLAQESYPEVALLEQVKAVGTLIALTFLLTLEDPHRFHKSRDVGCDLGLQPHALGTSTAATQG